jgi:PqqD family protein of HPr-rel-A system
VIPIAVVKPLQRSDVAFAQIGEEAVVFDPLHGGLHLLNPSAALVYRVCDGSATIDELADDVADAFGVPVGDVQPQVTMLVDSLAHIGLVEDATGARPDLHEHGPDAHGHDHGEPLDGRSAVRKEVPRST